MNGSSLTQAAWRASRKLAPNWRTLGPRFLPFADAATVDLPLARLLGIAVVAEPARTRA